MDGSTFDRIARLLGVAASRRHGIAAALGALAGAGAIASAGAQPPMPEGGPWPAGPCGPTGKENRCAKDKQCCTGYCRTGKKGKTGRCRCAPKNYPCNGKTVCCKQAACLNGVCTPTVQTGKACVSGTSVCRDAAAVCQAYDSDAPGGTYCLLPTGGACAASSDCWSQDCTGGVCADIVCDVCSDPLRCTYQTIDDAIAGTGNEGRIRIAPGTWTGPATSLLTKSLRFEACGGAPGVVITPGTNPVLETTGGLWLTVKNLTFDAATVYADSLRASGTSVSSLATLTIRGCTVNGQTGSLGVFGNTYSHVTVEDSTFTETQLKSAGASANDDPSTFTVSRSDVTLTGTGKAYCLRIEKKTAVTVTDSVLTGGGASNGPVINVNIDGGPSLTGSLTLAGSTTVTGGEATFAGGGVYCSISGGNHWALTMTETSSITGNAASSSEGSGLAIQAQSGATYTVTGASGRISGNTPDPQCTLATPTTFVPVANCVYV